MADVLCKVCEEPWEVHNGTTDMLHWETELFLQGAGCSSCEGEDDRGDLQVLADMKEKPAKRPDWEKPDPEPLWECDGCEVKAGWDTDTAPDDALNGELVWFGGLRVHYSSGIPREYGGHYSHDGPEETAPFSALNSLGEYCPGCADWCSECREEVVLQGHAAEGLDTEDPGYSFPHPDDYRKSGVCYDCHCHLTGKNPYGDREEDEETEDTGEE